MEKLKLTRHELYDMVWKEPMSTIAKRFNITDTGLRKACKRMNIPTPLNGYWSKLKFGKPVFQEKLPIEHDGAETIEIERLNEKSVTAKSERVKLTNEIKADKTLDLTIPTTLTDACQLVKDVNDYYQKKELDKISKNDELLGHYRQPYLDVTVTPEKLDRLLRFADALIKNLKQRGHDVKIVDGKTILVLFGEEFQITFRECTKREQITEIDHKYSWTRTVYVPTGVLSFRVLEYYGREWRDGGQLLEEQLAKILAQLEILGMKAKTERDIGRAWLIEHRKTEKEEEGKRENKRNEVRLFKNLLSEAKHFNEAQMIRIYIEAVKEKAGTGNLPRGKDPEWIQWAQAKADWFDPLVTKFDPTLGHFSIDYLEQNSRELF